MQFKFGELFCGAGGIGLGAKLAEVNSGENSYSINHVWATDYDRDSCDTYSYNLFKNKTKSVVCSDIRNLDLQKLKKISDIDALAFGFPCNDFSVVGEQKGINGAYGPLYSYGVKALHYFKPLWFLAENVGGIRNSNDGKTFKLILSDLYNSGYSIYPHLYKFDQYGVPQTRQRIIIVGIRKDLDLIYNIPSPDPYRDLDISAKKAIEDPKISSDVPNHVFTRQAESVIERLKHIKPGENAFTANLPKHLRLNVKGARISQIYRRLDANKPSYTVTGSGGGGTHVYHWIEPRALTNRERARLQTFPDNFIFLGSKESVRKQIGMAVPPNGIKIIFESILKSFAGICYDSIEPSIAPILHLNHKNISDNSIESEQLSFDIREDDLNISEY